MEWQGANFQSHPCLVKGPFFLAYSSTPFTKLKLKIVFLASRVPLAQWQNTRLANLRLRVQILPLTPGNGREKMAKKVGILKEKVSV
jgi:hypothetical protein